MGAEEYIYTPYVDIFMATRFLFLVGVCADETGRSPDSRNFRRHLPVSTLAYSGICRFLPKNKPFRLSGYSGGTVTELHRASLLGIVGLVERDSPVFTIFGYCYTNLTQYVVFVNTKIKKTSKMNYSREVVNLLLRG